ncbi:hypothetical protein AOLI_G00243530 [Acnodon oligacanthus]
MQRALHILFTGKNCRCHRPWAEETGKRRSQHLSRSTRKRTRAWGYKVIRYYIRTGVEKEQKYITRGKNRNTGERRTLSCRILQHSCIYSKWIRNGLPSSSFSQLSVVYLHMFLIDITL